jgi:hypothetical protein
MSLQTAREHPKVGMVKSMDNLVSDCSVVDDTQCQQALTVELNHVHT